MQKATNLTDVQPSSRSAAVGVAAVVACCSAVLAILALLLVVAFRRRSSDCKQATDYNETEECYMKTVADSGLTPV